MMKKLRSFAAGLAVVLAPVVCFAQEKGQFWWQPVDPSDYEGNGFQFVTEHYDKDTAKIVYRFFTSAASGDQHYTNIVHRYPDELEGGKKGPPKLSFRLVGPRFAAGYNITVKAHVDGSLDVLPGGAGTARAYANVVPALEYSNVREIFSGLTPLGALQDNSTLTGEHPFHLDLGQATLSDFDIPERITNLLVTIQPELTAELVVNNASGSTDIGTVGSRKGLFVELIATPVPEPATGAMLLGGLGLLGLARGRRKVG